MGQGTGNRRTHWTFISIPIMKMVEKAVPGCTIHVPNNNQTWEVKMLGFVDDKKHYINNILKQLQQTITESMQQLIRVWDEILTFVGGKLEMIKSNFYILDWTFDKSGKPILKNNKEIITFFLENNIQVQS